MKVECPRCKTQVTATPGAEMSCPTCGFSAPVPTGQTAPSQPTHTAMPTAASTAAPPGTAPGQPQKQGMAIASLVLGIVGCCVFPVLPSIAAAIMGGIAMKKAKDEPHEFGGHGMALAGLILGIIGAVLGLILVIVYAAALASVPPECWADPESAACDDALGGSPMVMAWNMLTMRHG